MNDYKWDESKDTCENALTIWGRSMIENFIKDKKPQQKPRQLSRHKKHKILRPEKHIHVDNRQIKIINISGGNVGQISDTINNHKPRRKKRRQ